MTFEKFSVLNGRTALAGLILDQSRTVPNQKIIPIVISR